MWASTQQRCVAASVLHMSTSLSSLECTLTDSGAAALSSACRSLPARPPGPPLGQTSATLRSDRVKVVYLDDAGASSMLEIEGLDAFATATLGGVDGSSASSMSMHSIAMRAGNAGEPAREVVARLGSRTALSAARVVRCAWLRTSHVFCPCTRSNQHFRLQAWERWRCGTCACSCKRRRARARS